MSTPTEGEMLQAESLWLEAQSPNAQYGVARIAQALANARARGAKPFEELFAGGPDTVCRTTWRDEDVWNGEARTECVEVPMDELRAAFEEAKR